jgi:hypothetical protein
MMLLALLQTASAGCGDVRIETAFTAVQTAYLTNDARATTRETRALTAAARCDAPSLSDLHRVHLAWGLRDLVQNRPGDEHFHAAFVALPTASLPADLAGDPRVRLAYARAVEQPVTWTRVEPYERDGTTWHLRPDVAIDLPKANRTPLIAAVGMGVLAAGLYGGAWAANASYQEVKGTGTREVVLPRYRATNALAVGSVVTAAASLGLFTVHVVR